MYHRDVIEQLQALIAASDQQRKQWIWAMPRDQWLMLRTVTQGDSTALIKPSVSWPHGMMMGYPVIVDNAAAHVELRVPEEPKEEAKPKAPAAKPRTRRRGAR
jgi:hypothetical protein